MLENVFRLSLLFLMSVYSCVFQWLGKYGNRQLLGRGNYSPGSASFAQKNRRSQ